MSKKIIGIFMLFSIVLMAFTNVEADTGLFNSRLYEDIYKLSEQGEDIDLPFLNVFMKAATIDKDVKNSGISFGSATIDVDKKLEGVQTILTQDMVTVKGEIEHAIIFANNIVIEGKLSGDSVLFGNTVQILDKAEIDKDVVIIAESLNLKGNVHGNVIATVSQEANISGKIDKDLRMIATKVNMENESIKGNFYLESDMDTTKIKEKYPNATIVPMVQKANKENEIVQIVLKGIITVVIYSFLTYLITKKDNNIMTKAVEKFREHTMYGVFISLIMFLGIMILPIILLLLAILNLGIIAWPILIAYIGIMLLTLSVSMLIVGSAIFEALKAKATKLRWLYIAGIFVVLYALTVIPYISGYATVAINLIALGMVMTMLTKKAAKKQEKIK